MNGMKDRATKSRLTSFFSTADFEEKEIATCHITAKTGVSLMSDIGSSGTKTRIKLVPMPLFDIRRVAQW